MTLDDLTLDIAQEVRIEAAVGDAFRSLLKRLSEDCTSGDGQPMPLVLEPWPGGRWFRDLGDKQGHLWGFVQVIKSPTLLEIAGPMFMSYPAAGHVQFRLTPTSGGVTLALRHRVLGLIEPVHREGVTMGWAKILEAVKDAAQR